MSKSNKLAQQTKIIRGFIIIRVFACHEQTFYTIAYMQGLQHNYMDHYLNLNIKLGQKRLRMTNTLAYYKN